MLSIHLREGRDLVIRDSCGTSDPYVKFKVGSKVVYKSRTIYKNLNPRWNERFTIPVDDITKPVVIKVFDYDRAWNDDPMGGVDLDLETLEVNKEADLKLLLTEKGKADYMGYLLLTCTLVPKSYDEKEQYFRRPARTTEALKRGKMQSWNGLVHIVLVEGSNLVAMDDNGFSDPYVKFRLGLEKYRSKFKIKTLNPCWLEQFDLRLYEEQTFQLEITVYDHDTRGKDDFMGRASIDLSKLEKDKTHMLEQQLEDGAGIIKLLLTITGTVGNEISSDLANYTPNALDKDNIISRYALLNSFSSLNDIGHLEVKVFRAHGLQAADFGGLSDPFCVLELVNNRVQTHTEYKTLNPEWSKVFSFPVKDIHSVLEVTVYDEDRNKKVEFLGKVAIPLLRIKNGERRWYALKDRKMIHKFKGAILLEMDLAFNHIKAGIRTVDPREEKLMLPEQRFKISIMKQNINRVSQLIGVFMETGRFVQSCFDWQSPPRTITAFIVYLVIVWNFELYMLPISLLLIFMKNLVVAQIIGSLKKEPIEDDYFVDDEDDDDDDDEVDDDKWPRSECWEVKFSPTLAFSPGESNVLRVHRVRSDVDYVERDHSPCKELTSESKDRLGNNNSTITNYNCNSETELFTCHGKNLANNTAIFNNAQTDSRNNNISCTQTRTDSNMTANQENPQNIIANENDGDDWNFGTHFQIQVNKERERLEAQILKEDMIHDQEETSTNDACGTSSSYENNIRNKSTSQHTRSYSYSSPIQYHHKKLHHAKRRHTMDTHHKVTVTDVDLNEVKVTFLESSSENGFFKPFTDSTTG
uniref:C2 domain-containing protein n=2 Tax=Arion vulgaris TaxID=1028688 RepID=A0A0B7BCF8_9EUPU